MTLLSFITRLFKPTLQSYKPLYKRNGVIHRELINFPLAMSIMFLLPW